jgi:Flp pilus assembly pilin Flp
MKLTLKNRKGQGTTEYVVIIALVIAVIVGFFPKIRDAITHKSDKVATMIETGHE